MPRFREGKPTRAVRGYDCVRISLAAVMLLAATLKAGEWSVDPPPRLGGLDAWFSLALVALEFAFGFWLLLGPAHLARFTSRAALVWFAALGSFSLVNVAKGETSCGCFGHIEVSPWVTLGLNAFAVAALVRWPPKAGRPSPSSSPLLPRPLTGVVAALVCAGVVVAARTPVIRAALETASLTASGEFAVANPGDWLGRRLPLLADIDIGERLSRGRWLVLFHRDNCDRCQALLPKYRELAERGAREAGAPRVALIEVPPYSGGFSQTELRQAAWTSGRLDEKTDWFVRTPLAVSLNDGVVQRPSSDIEAAGPFP